MMENRPPITNKPAVKSDGLNFMRLSPFLNLRQISAADAPLGQIPLLQEPG